VLGRQERDALVVDGGQAPIAAPGGGNLGDQARALVVVGCFIHELDRHPRRVLVAEALVVDLQGRIGRGLHDEHVAGCPHGQAGASGDAREHGRHVVRGDEIGGGRLKRLQACGEDGQLGRLGRGRLRRFGVPRPPMLPDDPEDTAGVASELARLFADGSRGQVERQGRL
jgi:hypothetical protein